MRSLRILNLEDDKLDTELIQNTLQEGGLDSDICRVQERADFLAALKTGDFDVILADHSLPGFDGLTALQIARQTCPEMPFIFVSGTLGEEVAIESLKSGATDYVLKHRLDRLASAVRRAVREAEERAERKRAEQALRDIRKAERRRIARDLHDVVLQDLSGALQSLQATQVELEDVELGTEVAALRRAVVGLRNAIYNLRLEGQEPFPQAVKTLVELNRRLAPQLETDLTVQSEFPEDLPERVRVDLLRIVQEALANARRHSDARRVLVNLAVDPDGKALLEVQDDGRGFDPSSIQWGVGISAMRERALEIYAQLEIESEPGKGTRVALRVPIPPEP